MHTKSADYSSFSGLMGKAWSWGKAIAKLAIESTCTQAGQPPSTYGRL